MVSEVTPGLREKDLRKVFLGALEWGEEVGGGTWVKVFGLSKGRSGYSVMQVKEG